MANPNTSWMPTKGRHRVEIGSSLARCLKNRKLNNGEASARAGKRSHLPDKDFYSFRYNHKPPSLDSKKQGMIKFEPGATPPVGLEHPSVQSGESTMYAGRETDLRQVDCVLIIDEDTGTYTLEKLDACVGLTFDRGLPSIMPRTASPTPSNSTPRGSSNDHTRDTIDQDTFSPVDEAPPSTSSKFAQKRPPVRREEEEEEEEEEGEDDDDDFPEPVRPPPQPKQLPQPAAPSPVVPPRPVKPMPKSQPKASPPKAPVPRAEVPQPRKKGPPRQRPTYSQDDDNQESDVPLSKIVPSPPVPKPKLPAKPAQLPAKPKPAPAKPPPPAKLTGLALPIKSSVPRPGSKKQSAAPTPAPPPQPPAPAVLALPGSSTAQPIRLPSSLPKPPPAPAAPVHEVPEDSDEEDNWEEVTTAAEAGAPPETSLSMQIEREMQDIFGEDDDDFGQQLELEMELADGLEDGLGDGMEDDEDDDDDMEPVPLPDGDGPISLNALAGGGAFNMGVLSDDDDSSSDDSDDY